MSIFNDYCFFFKAIVGREETDTIDIIDDLRHYIFTSSQSDLEKDLMRIDDLLNELGLEA